MAGKDRLAVCAIDFGTTRTGYAYWFRHSTEAELNVKDIHSEQVWDGCDRNDPAPTSVLLDEHQKFHSFGYDAERHYNDLAREGLHKPWYYFQYFKMQLHHKPEIKRNLLIQEVGGKSMSAMIVFSKAIEFIKDHVEGKIIRSKVKGAIKPTDIHWVITVPAIWRESAKQFTKEAALEAGIPEDQVSLALEPESTAIFCKEMSLCREGGIDGQLLRTFDPGEKYIVLDLGGGTIDATVHEVLREDGLLKVKEIHVATGGAWGGTTVNEAFENYIKEMVTPKVFKRFCEDFKSDWLALQQAFEREKRSVSKTEGTVTLHFPNKLKDIYEKKNDLLKLEERLKREEKYKNKAKLYESGMLIIQPQLMREFFQVAVDKITKLIESMLAKRELKDVSSLLLVGGLSQSVVVSSSIHRYFENRINVVVPENGSLATLKGAVMFGNDNRVIASRICPFTYGVHTRKPYDPKDYPRERRKTYNGREYVDYVFDKHLTVGERVYVGCSTKPHTYKITDMNNPHVYWEVYKSTKEEPLFCDEEGCERIGRLNITVPKYATKKTKNVKLAVSMTCQGTELEAEAYITEHNIRCKATFEFINDDPDSVDGMKFEASAS